MTTKIETGDASARDQKQDDHTAAMLSAITYCSLAPYNVEKSLAMYLKDWKLAWIPDEKHHVTKDGNYAFIATRGDTCAIAIRGSVFKLDYDGFFNWFEDFDIIKQVNWTHYIEPKPLPGTPMISKGADMGLNALASLKHGKLDILTYVKEFMQKGGKNIWITGHSLGGGLAPVFAAWLEFQLRDIKPQPNYSIITFAGPTTTNQYFEMLFTKRFGDNCRRYVNAFDVVPFSADNIGGICQLFDGSEFAPFAKNCHLPTYLHLFGKSIYDFFTKIAKDVSDAEIKLGSKYTPVGKTIILNPSKCTFSTHGNYEWTKWIGQMAAQHSHAFYLKLMDWPQGMRFTCGNYVCAEPMELIPKNGSDCDK